MSVTSRAEKARRKIKTSLFFQVFVLQKKVPHTGEAHLSARSQHSGTRTELPVTRCDVIMNQKFSRVSPHKSRKSKMYIF